MARDRKQRRFAWTATRMAAGATEVWFAVDTRTGERVRCRTEKDARQFAGLRNLASDIAARGRTGGAA